MRPEFFVGLYFVVGVAWGCRDYYHNPKVQDFRRQLGDQKFFPMFIAFFAFLWPVELVAVVARVVYTVYSRIRFITDVLRLRWSQRKNRGKPNLGLFCEKCGHACVVHGAADAINKGWAVRTVDDLLGFWTCPACNGIASCFRCGRTQRDLGTEIMNQIGWRREDHGVANDWYCPFCSDENDKEDGVIPDSSGAPVVACMSCGKYLSWIGRDEAQKNGWKRKLVNVSSKTGDDFYGWYCPFCSDDNFDDFGGCTS